MLCFYVLIILQIVVESFPVSSSGHAYIFLHWLEKLQYTIPEYAHSSWFNHLLHLPTIIILTFFYAKKCWPMLLHPWRYRNIIVRSLCIVFIADVITSLWYVIVAVYPLSKQYVGIGFIMTLLILYSLQYVPRRLQRISWQSVAVLLGFVQGVALLPGISRFAATYAVARWCGYLPDRSFALSWMVAYPLFCVAALHGLLRIGLGGIPTELLQPACVVSIISAMVVAWYALQYVYAMAMRRTLWKLYRYMIIPFALWALLF